MDNDWLLAIFYALFGLMMAALVIVVAGVMIAVSCYISGDRNSMACFTTKGHTIDATLKQ